jgi:GT2 family glycosyltransferase
MRQVKKNKTDSKNNFPLVSIIILNYNCMKYIKNCIESLLRTSYPNFEIIIVDNASTDGSSEFIKMKWKDNSKIKLIQNVANLGYTGGNNIGIKYSKGKYIVFLNCDTRVEPEWLTDIINEMERDNSIGVAMPKIMALEPQMSNYICTFGLSLSSFGILLSIGYTQKDFGQYTKIIPIFSASGSAMCVRKSLIDIMGGFDDYYFLYFDDVDLCCRAWLHGYKVLFIPGSSELSEKKKVYHRTFEILSSVTTAVKTKRYRELFYTGRNAVYFFFKNFELKDALKMLIASSLVMWLLVLGRTFIRRDPLLIRALFVGYLQGLINLRKATTKRAQQKKSLKNLFRVKDYPDIITKLSIPEYLLEVIRNSLVLTYK